jgi:hypothetical protein
MMRYSYTLTSRDATANEQGREEPGRIKHIFPTVSPGSVVSPTNAIDFTKKFLGLGIRARQKA